MLGKELLETMDVPVAEYTLSVSVSNKISIEEMSDNGYPLGSAQYQCELRGPDDKGFTFPFFCGPILKHLDKEDFSITTDEDSPFYRLIGFLETYIWEVLDESVLDYNDFCNEYGYNAYEEGDNEEIIEDPATFKLWKKLNDARDMVSESFPEFNIIQGAFRYNIEDENGEAILLPNLVYSDDPNVSLILQSMLDTIEYTDSSGKKYAVDMETLNPELGNWLWHDISPERSNRVEPTFGF